MTRIAVLLAATALGLGALGCGGSDDQSSTGVSLPTVTVPTVPQSQAPTTTSSAASGQNPPAQTQTTALGASHGSCPPTLSKSECRTLADAVARGESEGGPLRCTPQMSPETCQALQEIAGAKPSGNPQAVPGCTGLSREECAALLEKSFGG
jgi:hypothetical protein